MDNCKVILIPIQDVTSVFPSVEQFIKQAIEHANGETNIQGVFRQLLAGQKQLWVIAQNYVATAAAITEVTNYPTMRVVRIVFLGGDGLDKWSSKVDETVSQWARIVNAKRVEVIGRKGWERHLKSRGYKPAYVHLLKEL